MVENLVLMKNGEKLVFNIKITTKNGFISCLYLWRDQKVGAMFTNTEDLATIKALQDSSITMANKNWHIVVDQYTGYQCA